MSTFDNREKAFENKFVHDEALKFKATARRNKLFGLEVAALLGKTDESAEAYAKEVVAADFEESGDEDIFRKVKADFESANLPYDRAALDVLLQKSMDKAIIDVQG